MEKETAPGLYTGISTDTKPGNAAPGSRCFELDTGRWYVTADGTSWVVDNRAWGY